MDKPEGSSRLSGSLAPKEGNRSGLKGSLLLKKEEVPTDDVFIGMVVVHRDTERGYEVKALHKVGEKELVNLLGTDGNKVSLDLTDFKEKLRTEGSPWRRK